MKSENTTQDPEVRWVFPVAALAGARWGEMALAVAAVAFLGILLSGCSPPARKKNEIELLVHETDRKTRVYTLDLEAPAAAHELAAEIVASLARDTPKDGRRCVMISGFPSGIMRHVVKHNAPPEAIGNYYVCEFDGTIFACTDIVQAIIGEFSEVSVDASGTAQEIAQYIITQFADP